MQSDTPPSSPTRNSTTTVPPVSAATSSDGYSGRTTVNGDLNDDLQRNWRVGGTLAFPLDAHHSVKLYASNGVSARTGNSYDLYGIAWQYRWGGGL